MRFYELVPQPTDIEIFAAFFEAYGNARVMLAEGRIDEAGFWSGVGKAASKVASGVGKVARGSALVAGETWKGIKTGKEAIDKLTSLAQSSKPVQNFDAQADNLIQQISAKTQEKYPKVASAVATYAKWAKANPVKQGLVVGLLTAILSLVAGPAGGAAAGYVLRFASELLKGEKMSTAIGKGVAGAGLGFLAGATFKSLADIFGHVNISRIPGVEAISHLKSTSNINGHLMQMDITVPSKFSQKFQMLFKLAQDNISSGNVAKANQIMDQLDKIVAQTSPMVDQMLANNAKLKADALSQAANFKAVLSAIGEALQGAANTSGKGAPAPQAAAPQPTQPPAAPAPVAPQPKAIGKKASTSAAAAGAAALKASPRQAPQQAQPAQQPAQQPVAQKPKPAAPRKPRKKPALPTPANANSKPTFKTGAANQA